METGVVEDIYELNGFTLMLLLWVATPNELVGIDTNISGLKMEAVRSSETLICIYKSTCRYNREDEPHIHLHKHL
jgi:hypothetical protein